MILYNINEIYSGLKIIQNGDPCVIISKDCIKPGKGRAFNRVRFRNIKSGKILEKTFKSGVLLESADVLEKNLIYMYHDHIFWYFMDEKVFNQTAISLDIIGNNVKWMVEQLYYTVTFWNKVPILVIPPHYVELKVINTTSVMKNSTISSGTKLATVSTGAVIKIPFFIQSGEYIKIDTYLGEYIARIK